MLQFVVITGAAEWFSLQPKQYHTEFKYIPLSINWKVFAYITILMFPTLPPSKKAEQLAGPESYFM